MGMGNCIIRVEVRGFGSILSDWKLESIDLLYDIKYMINKIKRSTDGPQGGAKKEPLAFDDQVARKL